MPEAVIETVRDLRRSQILDAARSIVAVEGLAKLTFGELEKRLAFSRGVITYHFKNKDDIVYALLDDAIRQIGAAAQDAVDAATEPGDAVVAAVRAMVDGFLRHRDATHVLVSFWGRLQSDDRARHTNARLYATWREQAAGLVVEGQRLGRFRKSADPQAVGAALVAAVIGIVAQVIFEEGTVDVDAAVRVAAGSVASWLVVEPHVS